MTPTLGLWMALLFSIGGMGALSLAMDRHHEQVTMRAEIAPGRRLALRAGGAALVAVAAAVSVQAWGGSVGVVMWLGALSAGALGVSLLLSLAPRWTPRLAGGAAWLGAALMVGSAVR